MSDTGSQCEHGRRYRQDPSESRRESVPLTVAVFDDELNWVTVDDVYWSTDQSTLWCRLAADTTRTQLTQLVAVLPLV